MASSPTSPDLQIVTFADRHAASFRELNIEWIAHYFEVEETDLQQMDQPREQIIDPGGEIFMAELDGEPVGTVALLYLQPGRYELAKMAVTPAAQGRGIGRKLVEAALDWARDRQAKSVMLLSNRVLGPALHLYRKAGFREVAMDPKADDYQRCDITMEIGLQGSGAVPSRL